MGCGGSPPNLDWPDVPDLAPPEEGKLAAVGRTFEIATNRGTNNANARLFARLNAPLQHRLDNLCLKMERDGASPDVFWHLLRHLRPKLDGGRRPTWVLTMPLRV